ncbi:MAG: patatin-like phospholipase family protein [Spirochaetota bacterium]
MFGFGGRTVALLSIDGGGMRGLIPALVLRELRDRLRAGGVDDGFHRLFHMMAGTSTGGLICLALSLPAEDPGRSGGFSHSPALSIDDVVRLYEEMGPEIFPRSVFRGLRKVEQVFREKYASEPAQRIYGKVFGGATLKHSLCHLLIPSYDIERETVFLFKHRPSRREKTGADPNFLLSDVALATTAAPTYFEPARVRPVGGGEPRVLLDGGIYASNPSMCAYIEAKKTFSRVRNLLILSLGTGSHGNGFSYQDMKSWGYLDWVSPVKGVPLFRTMAGAHSECVDHQLRKLPGVTYVRLNGPLEERCELDDAGPRAMEVLRKAAGRIIEENGRLLDRICGMLKPGLLG